MSHGLRPLFVLVSLWLAGGETVADTWRFSGPTMGTTYHITVVAPKSQRTPELQFGIEERLLRLSTQFSTYDPKSELSQFNKSRSTEFFPVSVDVAQVVARGLQISELSGGAFDPTVGPLVRLWGFGSAGPRQSLPTAEEITALRAHSGYHLVEVKREPPALRKADPLVELDLSAIAKGYAVDVLTEWLQNQPGLTAGLVEIGGEVRAFGRREEGTAWQVGIEYPDPAVSGLCYTVALQDAALATSGNYRNWFEVQGTRYAHTLNPHTGWPVQHTLASVSVLAPDCMTADALATTLNVLGPEAGTEFALQQRICALLLVHEKNGIHPILIGDATHHFQSEQGAPAADLPQGKSRWWVIELVLVLVLVTGVSRGVLMRSTGWSRRTPRINTR